jgi:iduronate 2-sulfatase
MHKTNTNFRFLFGGASALRLALLAAAAVPLAPAAAAPARPNVLFIAVDDLRPQLGCYGVTSPLTPQLDALAARGLLFTRAYCQQATCSPSRTSLLTGRRPDTTKIYDLNTHLRKTMPDVVTLPEYFKQHGYFTQSFGKIFHGGLDDPRSWSISAVGSGRTQAPAVGGGAQSAGATKQGKSGGRASWRIIPPAEESRHTEQLLLDSARQALRGYRTNAPGQPFFLAVGFHKPHLPFEAPQRFFDLYPLDRVPLAANPFLPKNSPAFATTDDSGEVRTYSDIPAKAAGPIGEAKARELVRGYFACVSYVDSLIGELLRELDRLEYRENTIIVLWGDHGWHLGEHAQWGKHTNFEVGTRVPLIISHPGQTTRGRKTDRIAELVDLYPTLCALAGLPLAAGLEGDSLLPVLMDPTCPWDSVAISQWPRPYMGYSMRTDRYRYTEWVQKGDRNTPPAGVELYDHHVDPDENINLAGLPEHAALLAQLRQRLQAERQ